MERTLVLIKPDAIERKLVGEILARYERRGLSIVAIRNATPSPELVTEHYVEFFDDAERVNRLVGFMAETTVIALILEGPAAIAIARQVNGKTSAAEAIPGTIRGDFADNRASHRTLVHASDSLASAVREIQLWFPEYV